MARITYNKLVRDRIPEIIRADNAEPFTRVLSEEEFTQALKDKLVEEAKELAAATSRDDIVNELSDVWQLVESIVSDFGITLEEVETAKEDKKTKRGSFEQRLFLEYVDKAA